MTKNYQIWNMPRYGLCPKLCRIMPRIMIYAKLCSIMPNHALFMPWEIIYQIYPKTTRCLKFSSSNSTNTTNPNHSQFYSIMATFIPQYDATFLIRQSPATPDLAVITAVQNSFNVSTGSFIILRTSSDPNHITFGAQVGWLVGFCGRFAFIKLNASGLPGLEFLMIVESWLRLDRFEWNLQYYELMGGIPFNNIFYRLTLTPLRWVLENGEWRTTYEPEE